MIFKTFNLLLKQKNSKLVSFIITNFIDIDRELCTLIQWLVGDNEEIIACGAVLFYEFPPSYTNKTGKKAYIVNMYTNQNYRGQGIATKLLTKLVDEVKSSGISKIWLGASKMGRPVYKKFGFRERDEFLELNII
ncbi:GNAT family N-acetyltransferase [Neobacillus cucumis]|nr:GNAT family N-acetyltransferase [Neobacillus cucumis]